jgi:carboxypeptidase C (cathepsin A)
LTGESYAGVYIPYFAKEILKRKEVVSKEMGSDRINYFIGSEIQFERNSNW